MNEIDSTIHGIIKLKNIVAKFNDEFDSSIKVFLNKFNGKGSDVSHEDDAISMELKETFFRLMEVKDLINTVDSLLVSSEKSLNYAKDDSEEYKTSDIFVKRADVHDFLLENVERGDEGEWALIFDSAYDTASSVFQFDGILYHEISLDWIISANYTVTDLSESDVFFPSNGWEEQNVKMIKTSEGKLIKVVD